MSYNDEDRPKRKATPNKDLDKAIKDILKNSSNEPFDSRIKALNMAISWEKAKHGILSDEDDFDSEDI
jgi:hypothetical protein